MRNKRLSTTWRFPAMVMLAAAVVSVERGSTIGAERYRTAAAIPQAPTNPVYGMGFSPYVLPGQDPNLGGTIPAAQITTLLSRLKGYTEWIRTFGTENGLQYVAAIAHQMGFKTAIGAYIGPDLTVDSAQMTNLINEAKAGNVDIAVVGNETLLNNYVTEARLIDDIKYVKSHVPTNVLVTYADTWNTINAHPNVIAACDIVAANFYPFYQDTTIGHSLGTLQRNYATTVMAAHGKPVIITETGWPSSGSPPFTGNLAVPSASNAAAYFKAIENWARPLKVPTFYFESYDEPWKTNYGDYPSWGIWKSDGTLKPGMSIVFE